MAHCSSPLLPLLFLLISFPPTFNSQSTRDDTTTYNFKWNFNPVLQILILVLLVGFFLAGFFTIYLNRCRENNDTDEMPLHHAVAQPQAEPTTGIDPLAIENLPTVMYSQVKEHRVGKDALECAVCLIEFEDDKTLTLLPTCDHVFHGNCISTWLSSHVTCPICRSNVDPTSYAPTDQVVQIEDEAQTQPLAQSPIGERAWSMRSWSARLEKYWSEGEQERFKLRL